MTSLPGDVVTPAELVVEFSTFEARKPIIIDLKVLRTEKAVRQAKGIATQLAARQDVEIWFISSSENANSMPSICEVLGSDFELLLYSRGGTYCDHE